MFLRVGLEVIVGDAPSPDVWGDQGKPFIGFGLRIRRCRRIIAGWHLVSWPVNPLRIAFGSEPPYTIDLIAAHQAFRFSMVPSPPLGQLVDVVPCDRAGICQIS